MIRVNLNDWSAEVKVLPGDDNIPLGIESVWVDDTGEIYITTETMMVQTILKSTRIGV